MSVPTATLRVAEGVDLLVSYQACPLCGSEDFAPLAAQDRHLLGLVTAGCRGCGLVQTNPRPDAAQLAAFYAQHYRKLYQGVDDPSDAYISSFRKGERLRYSALRLMQATGLPPEGSLLDYGCGEGSLFVALRGAGFKGRLAGVEANLNFGRFAAQVGDADVRSDLQDLKGFDVIVLNHVLEHLADPIGVLEQLRERMKPGGFLYVDVPDTDRYTRVADFHLAHLLHLTIRTLPRLVQAAGFEVLSCQPHDPPHHPRSLLLLARPAELARGACTPAVFSAAQESGTWCHLRRLDRWSWLWLLERRLARVGLLRKAYRRIHSLLSPRLGP